MDHGDIPSDPWPVIERAIARVARRHALSTDEAEDFTSWARLHLLESKAAPLSRFRGDSSFETFLGVVVVNLFRDYRISKWGKWRPSAAARRLGPVAILLETFIFRDGLSEREAVALVAQRADAPPPAEIEALVMQLPVRTRPRFESEDALRDVPIAGSDSERGAVARELEPIARRVEAALRRALAESPAQDRLLLKLRFQEGLKVVEIARILHTEAKGLYPRLERCVAALRHELEAAGVRAEEAMRLLDWAEFDLDVDYRVDGEGDAVTGSTSTGSRKPTENTEKRDPMSV